MCLIAINKLCEIINEKSTENHLNRSHSPKKMLPLSQVIKNQRNENQNSTSPSLHNPIFC